MTLQIISADQRIAEAQGKTTIELFGPAGVRRAEEQKSTRLVERWICPVFRTTTRENSSSAIEPSPLRSEVAR